MDTSILQQIRSSTLLLLQTVIIINFAFLSQDAFAQRETRGPFREFREGLRERFQARDERREERAQNLRKALTPAAQESAVANANSPSSTEATEPSLKQANQNNSKAPQDTKLTQADVLEKAQAAWDEYQSVVLSTENHSVWDLVHAVLGYGPAMRVATKSGDTVNVIDWLRSGATQGNVAVFEKTPYGIRGQASAPLKGPFVGGLEGHPNQFFGYLADLDIPLDTPWLSRSGKEWVEGTFSDLVNDAKAQVSINPSARMPFEKTWTLWGLARYLHPDESWIDVKGEKWSIARLLEDELSQGIKRGASCYGMHRAYAIADALYRWESVHGPVTEDGSVYHRAKNQVSQWIQTARLHQLGNGDFSADHLYTTRDPRNIRERITANGHILEFLMLALPDDYLNEHWVRLAVWATADSLLEVRNEIPTNEGPTFHALHAIRMYLDRIHNRASAQTVSGEF